MIKLLQGQCHVCRGPLEFPADAVGTTTDCPHCGKPTELFLAAPPQERVVPVRTILYTVIAILILVGALVAAMIALKRAERIWGKPPATPTTAPVSPQNK